MESYSTRMSPSRLGTFLQCGQKFKYKYVDGLPDPTSPAAAKGLVVHETLEYLFLCSPAVRTLSNALSLLDKAHAAWEGEPVDLEACQALILNYFDLEDPSLVDVDSTELKLEVGLPNGRVMNGIIDRLDRLPDGSLQVVDYKSGKMPSDEDMPLKSFGMRFYAEMVARLTGEWPTRLVLLYLGNPARVVLPLDKQALRAANTKITTAWDAIDRGEFKPKPSWSCKFCPYREICPAIT